MTRIQIEFTDIIANQVRWERKNKAIPLMGGAIVQSQLVILSWLCARRGQDVAQCGAA